MGNHRAFHGQFWLAIGVALAAAGMWIYASRVLIPYHIADAARHHRPRGNLSDLYPPWLGAREVFLRGRNPYSNEVTREIQTGYYGRPLNPSRADDPADEQRFAYPVYVAFVLAPTFGLPFEVVQKLAFWILLICLMAGILFSLRILRWSPPPWIVVSLIGFAIGSPTVMQGLKLRQLSLLEAALVFGALALLVSGRLSAAGCLLALATIKPQLVWLLLLWLTVWTFADWKRRYRFMVSFLVTMLVLVAGAEILLPGWILGFWEAIHAYRRYTSGASVLETMTLPSVNVAVAILGAVLIGRLGWRERIHAPNTESFSRMVCLLLSVTILISPNSALYNQILLFPALFLLARDWRRILEMGWSGTLLTGFVVAAIGWPGISSTVLAGLSFAMRPEAVQRLWTVPLWTVWLIPVSVSGLMLVMAHHAAFGRSENRLPA